MCLQANWRSWTQGRAPSYFVGFFNPSSHAPTRDQLFKVILRNRLILVAFYYAHGDTKNLFPKGPNGGYKKYKN